MKNRLPFILLGGLVLLFIGVMAAEPQPLNWRPNLERDSAQPFGAEIFFTLLPRWLGSEGAVPVTVVEDPPFLHLADTTHTGTTYLFLTQQFSPDPAEAGRLLDYAARGNTVLVAAEMIEGLLADTLGIPYDSLTGEPPGLYSEYRAFGTPADSALHLLNPALQMEGGYRFPFEVAQWALTGLDSTRSTLLAVSGGDATFVRIGVGEGQVLLASTPLAFSNAALTGEGDGPAFVEGALAYVPAQPLFWDAYHKPFRTGATTPLGHILRAPALRWTYLLLIVGALLFLFFRGRRWQRPVPVVTPPPNAQLEFVRTVGRLYFQHGDARALVRRKERYFLDRLRTRLYLDSPDLSEETERFVVQRSGLAQEQIATLFRRFRRARRTPNPPAQDLLDLDRALDSFYEGIGVRDAAERSSGTASEHTA